MAKKVVKQRKRGRQAGVSSGPRRILTDEIRKEILADIQDHSKLWVAKHWHIGTIAVSKLIAENPSPVQITARETLDPLKRTELLALDSIETLELTIYSMQTLLEREVAALKADKGTKPTITARELRDFFETVAPYVLQKVESTPAKKKEVTPLGKVHNMFAKKHE